MRGTKSENRWFGGGRTMGLVDDPEARTAFGPVLQRSEVPDDILEEMEDYMDDCLDAIFGADL